MGYRTLLTDVFERIAGCRGERPSAGTKYRLMGLVADITEVAEVLQAEVLQRVSQEAVVDADVDVDYAELSEQVLLMELPEVADADEVVREKTQQVNDALGALSDVLLQISEQLERRHDEIMRLMQTSSQSLTNYKANINRKLFKMESAPTLQANLKAAILMEMPRDVK